MILYCYMINQSRFKTPNKKTATCEIGCKKEKPHLSLKPHTFLFFLVPNRSQLLVEFHMRLFSDGVQKKYSALNDLATFGSQLISCQGNAKLSYKCLFFRAFSLQYEEKIPLPCPIPTSPYLPKNVSHNHSHTVRF